MPFGEDSVLGRRYRLVSQVGRGGMGRVWHAHDDLLHRDVAVKEVIFPPGLSSSDREVLFERTLREARSAARLSHRGIVTVHDVVEEDDRPWIVMEYVRARSLQEIIDDDGPLSPPRVADIGAQMLAALRVAHAAGVLHRDVKPANVLLDTGGHHGDATRVVITDFGIARIDGDATLTQAGLVLGSPAYIAPERARGELASPASDLWALGATLYAACEGRSPHDRVEAMAALSAVLHEEAAPPRRAGPLAPVLMGLLVKDPALRMTADQAAADLARAARGDTPARPPAPADTWQHTARSPVPERGVAPADDETVRDVDRPVTEVASVSRPPDAEARRRPSPWLIVAMVVLVAVLAVAGVLLTRHAAGGSSASPSPSPSLTPTPPTSTPTPTPTPGRDATTPPGWSRVQGPYGSSIALPAGWTRQMVTPTSVQFVQRATGAQVQVDAIPWGVANPTEHWRRFAGEVRTKNALPAFRELSLSNPFTARGWSAADFEYTWLTRDYGTLRGYDRGFTANGRQYAILVAGPAGKWDRFAGLPKTIFDSFRPAGG
ncbi:MAG TPA: serine/threonine-protein kinase [Actinoallomurus sp.]|jgi:serine/threonine protein kinase